MDEREKKKREWESVIEFYRKVDGKNRNKYEEKLARSFFTSIYSEKLYPFVSHRELCITPTSQYTEIRNFPMVGILHLGNGKFSVEFWEKRWKKKEMKRFETEDSRLWDLLNTLLPKLISDS
ncbi:MAG: hypothetical protein R2747_02995 [Pyrinomonadaceae bacterium]